MLACNTDQGSQFTSLEFTERMEQEAILIGMKGRGRVYGNIFIERLWEVCQVRGSLSPSLSEGL